ncbi:NAD(P)/FAD-dependent oxidoreductase [Phenylobacterium sp.]|uniref:NAD(P)/FAD-dependent oxidoreductase n=1 Tax=Phenylobacterium sp. TaxID=1871053 RepID=UPI0039838373
MTRAPQPAPQPRTAAVIGAGPAGLMAAEVLAAAGVRVTVFERMPSPGRKLLMAGRGGLNLTHAEPFESFLPRYGEAPALQPALEAFPPAALVAWVEALGQPTFVGSSGRVFPKALKASPVLRAWLRRLEALRVEIRTRHTWTGWDAAGALTFAEAPAVRPEVTVLALGGASWPRLGSDGAWTAVLSAEGIAVTPLQPANVGFDVAWSPLFRDRFAGTPLKGLALAHAGRGARGEVMITAYGLEGGALYALAAPLRDAIAADGGALLEVDLRPDQSVGQLTGRLAATRQGETASHRLRRTLNLSPAETSLLREGHGVALPSEPGALARAVKWVPIKLTGVQPIGRAISTAGGVAFAGLDAALMLRARPGVFVAGEMLDWEAPTGGYLLQASFATGVGAATGALAWLEGGGPARP